jgi:hypothetical protein
MLTIKMLSVLLSGVFSEREKMLGESPVVERFHQELGMILLFVLLRVNIEHLMLSTYFATFLCPCLLQSLRLWMK